MTTHRQLKLLSHHQPFPLTGTWFQEREAVDAELFIGMTADRSIWKCP